MPNETIFSIIDRLDQLSDELTIYAREDPFWSMTSPAIVVKEPEDGTLPVEAIQQGMAYLLEVFIAKEVLQDWLKVIGQELSTEDKCYVVIYYASHDTWPPWPRPIRLLL